MALGGRGPLRELHSGGGVQANVDAALGGEGGFGGNMKRAQTAEEREREAKVSGAPAIWDCALVRG